MPYRLLLLDIDGTLRPVGCERIPAENVAAVQALQKAGIRLAIATGRGRCGVGSKLLHGLKPDYWLCAGGAQVLDGAGKELAVNRFTNEEMYALVDFFEDHELPLRFSYHDANYAYLDYETFMTREQEFRLDNHIVDGQDQNRHLQDMPFGAFGFMPRYLAAEFSKKYPHLGLSFLYSGPTGCDILRRGVNKAAALEQLTARLGLTPADCVAMGDGENDADMLRAAGYSVAMASGSKAAMDAATIIGPDAAPHGVADACRAIWPEILQ